MSLELVFPFRYGVSPWCCFYFVFSVRKVNMIYFGVNIFGIILFDCSGLKSIALHLLSNLICFCIIFLNTFSAPFFLLSSDL